MKYKHENNLPAIVEETQKREHLERKMWLCGRSWVQPMQNSIVLNGAKHSGIATHICARRIHPDGEPCVCECSASQVTSAR